ncbi:hypothetical protein FLL78_13290 [Vibrio cholerae]|nr:hypothetical protein FLL78_13290 [Vibrio cholerae]
MARKRQRSGLSRPFLCHLNADSSHIFVLMLLMEEIVSLWGEFFVATLITAWVKTLCLWIL